MRTAAAVLLALLLAAPVLALSRRADEPAEAAFAPVPTRAPSLGLDPALVSQPVRVPIVDVWPAMRPVLPRRAPRVAQPSSHLIVIKVGAPRPTGHRASGVASWYCGHGSACTRGYPGGLYAAAGPALRRGDWRGRVVLVRSGASTVRVRLVDWCQCGNGARVIDLYRDAFSRLADPSRGVLNVTVTW